MKEIVKELNMEILELYERNSRWMSAAVELAEYILEQHGYTECKTEFDGVGKALELVRQRKGGSE